MNHRNGRPPHFSAEFPILSLKLHIFCEDFAAMFDDFSSIEGTQFYPQFYPHDTSLYQLYHH